MLPRQLSAKVCCQSSFCASDALPGTALPGSAIFMRNCGSKLFCTSHQPVVPSVLTILFMSGSAGFCLIEEGVSYAIGCHNSYCS